MVKVVTVTAASLTATLSLTYKLRESRVKMVKVKKMVSVQNSVSQLYPFLRKLLFFIIIFKVFFVSSDFLLRSVCEAITMMIKMVNFASNFPPLLR